MDISYHRYGLKLRDSSPANARTSRRVLEGILIRVDGGYGCVQPWPELGDETLEQQWQALKSGQPTRLLTRAFFCAAQDSRARQEGCSLFDGLKIPPSHATVTGDPDFAALREQGYAIVKLKGGSNWQVVLERMHKAVSAGLRVRVDFNGTLDHAQFLEFACAARDVREAVDFVEDPVPYHPEVWEELRQKTGWRFALDRAGEAGSIGGGYDVRVLKPAADSMDDSGLHDGPVVITSYMDHPLGQAFAAWEAGRFGGQQEGSGLMTHHLFEADDFTRSLAQSGPVWCSPGGTGLGFDDLLANLPWIELSPRRPAPGRVLQNPRDPLPGTMPPLDPGQIGFATSGSTGTPSIVVHTTKSLTASSRAVNDWLNSSAEDVWLRALPDFHAGGYQIGVRAGLSGSRVAVLEGKWNALAFLEECRNEAATLCSLVPAQVVDLVGIKAVAPAGLRAVVVGGGSLEIALEKQARELGWPILVSYGATEAASQIATQPLADIRLFKEADQFPSTLIDSSKMEVMPHWEARLVPAAGHDGSGGLLELRGPALAMKRYRWSGQVWQPTPIADELGWWRTSDLVTLTGRHLTFVGRSDRVVKVLGELVSLDAVETALVHAGLPADTFAVLAIPEERRGFELVLIMEAPPGESVIEGIAALELYAKSAPPFALLGRVIQVNGLPRSSLGKIRLTEAAGLVPPREVP